MTPDELARRRKHTLDAIAKIREEEAFKKRHEAPKHDVSKKRRTPNVFRDMKKEGWP